MQKILVQMTTLSTENEQSGVSPKTVTVSGNSREYGELARCSRAAFVLWVSAMSGTASPSLTVKIQAWDESAAQWIDEVTFTAVTAVTSVPVVQKAELYFTRYRAVWTVTGTTPSFTFSLDAYANADEPGRI